ncbi:hypothetical protein MJ575_08625 [Klebsiella pneumoniae]|nr:hypothetical protein MJ575_08625 [Klebsiella pneumoniae]
MARLTALLAQFAADPTLRCGEAEMLSADELPGWRRSTIPLCQAPATTLSALVADQARKTRPMRRRWRTPAGSPAIAMRPVVVALRAAAASARRSLGTRWRVALPRSVFLDSAPRHCRMGPPGALDTGYLDDRLRMMLEDARPPLLIATEDQLARFSDIPVRSFLPPAAAGRRG